ncbi:MAG: acetate--CoA ligase family protein, partial [Proteobacteria bacterium]|nr:acetate--CoA ligase family protein [Pseudomonadota bacterium]
MITREKVAQLIVEKHASGVNVISEDEAKQIFSCFGIPVVREKRVKGIAQAVDAAKETGFPVALKGIGSKILHKTEAGMVCLGLGNEEQVRQAAQQMEAAGKNSLEAFLVQPMVLGKREFVAGMFNDPQFGPVIMFGLGGILTEALNDIVLKIAPLKDADMEDMMAQLSAKKLLEAFRGEAAADREMIKKILGGLSDLALENPNIREIDINPLIIRKDGSPIAVDGLLVLGKRSEKKETHIHSKPIDLSVLGACFYPESIAFIGASATPGKWGHMLPT